VKSQARLKGLVLVITALVASLLCGVYIGVGSHNNLDITLYEDGSFELLEHGKRIGYGCLDGELCED
jgi:hypothetical protein